MNASMPWTSNESLNVVTPGSTVSTEFQAISSMTRRVEVKQGQTSSLNIIVSPTNEVNDIPAARGSAEPSDAAVSTHSTNDQTEHTKREAFDCSGSTMSIADLNFQVTRLLQTTVPYGSSRLGSSLCNQNSAVQ